ncbi:9486_t:CDS:1 [Cetraspora pellucida]|uniref:9486_t:CDS:1 n=1 Tax=Cetraspora pellucida TaxID=1433469 RepID=A0A9N9NR93_9GLOM|nr:9486_t:CDS:1 [Cetraspora pellucida]
MRVAQTTSYKAKEFAEYLLRIGNDTETTIANNLICLSDKIVIHLQKDEDSINLLTNAMYQNLSENATNTLFMTERAILTPLNSDVNKLNEKIMTKYSEKQ